MKSAYWIPAFAGMTTLIRRDAGSGRAEPFQPDDAGHDQADAGEPRRRLDGEHPAQVHAHLLGERVDALEEENETCRGENRELRQHLSSLEVILRDAGIPVPAKELPGSLVVIEGRRTTVMKPRPRKP